MRKSPSDAYRPVTAFPTDVVNKVVRKVVIKVIRRFIRKVISTWTRSRTTLLTSAD